MQSLASPPPPRPACAPEWMSSERFLSAGFHSSRAIPTQRIPSSLGFATVGLQVREML